MLDTDTVSHALRRNAGVVQRLGEVGTGEWCISAVTRGELRYGVARAPEATRLAQLVSAFLEIAPCAPWDSAAADRHGGLRARLAAAGRSVGAFDEMIAAHALSLDVTLVTGNLRHLGRIEGLRTEDWIAR